MTLDSIYPSSLNVLIIDDSLGDYIISRRDIEKYNGGELNPRFTHTRHPEEGLELLTNKEHENFDLVVLDPNTFALKPESIAGIDRFLTPMRQLGYTTPVICHTYRDTMTEEEALRVGATAYAGKEDEKSLIRALEQVFQPVRV
jgi:CheY-like chemotaxis protein